MLAWTICPYTRQRADWTDRGQRPAGKLDGGRILWAPQRLRKFFKKNLVPSPHVDCGKVHVRDLAHVTDRVK